MHLELKEEFKTIQPGSLYFIPKYEVLEGKGIHPTGGYCPVLFVRGSKLNKEHVPKCEGSLHEHYLAVMIHDLKIKNDLVPSRETALAITKLQEALHWPRQRQVDRIKREVQGTYQE